MRAAVIAGALAVAAPAEAEIAVPPRARELAREGRVAHDARDYPRAISAFKEAYVLSPSPVLLFDLAQSYRLAGDCKDAAWMYRRYLDSDPDGDGRALAMTHLREVEKCAPHPAAVHPPPPPPPDPPGRGERLLGIGLATGGAVLLAGAGYFAVEARDAADRVGQTYEHGGAWTDIASQNARGERSAEIATALGIGGGVAVVAGAVCYGLGYRAEAARRLAIAPSARGASVTVGWTW